LVYWFKKQEQEQAAEAPQERLVRRVDLRSPSTLFAFQKEKGRLTTAALILI
jgi:hypothetical protein